MDDTGSVTAEARLERLLHDLKQEFPKFRIVAKQQDRLSHLIDASLRAITLGGQNRYMTEYHTVIGDTLYVPDSWQHLPPLDRVILLRHERIHLRQRRRWTFLGMAFVYLVPWFPLGLAYGRARLEWEAYQETLRATLELKGLSAVRCPNLRRHILDRFCGPDYGWMWPFRRQLERWYDTALQELEGELAANHPER